MSHVLDNLPADPILERRALIQEISTRTMARRNLKSRAFMTLLGATLAIALIPLFLVLFALLQKGFSVLSWTFITKPPIQPTLLDQNDVGGIGPAIAGSVVIDALAALVAVPVGIILGLFLAERDSPIPNAFRAVIEIMTGLPSILLGVFAYVYIVTAMGTYSGFAASCALAVMMTPVITKAAETAIRGVPNTLTEAGLALGARRSTVSLKVVLPVAVPGVITGVLLALARAIGETAPLLLVIGASIRFEWNPLNPMAAMPTTIFNYSSAAYDSQHQAAWGVALVLVVVVLILSLSSRLISARMRREKR
jgi:phosphate transport system permease protein